MLSHVPRLPFSLDPLIAEAKRRMRRRRLLVVAVLVLAGGTVAAVIASGSPGGPRSTGPSRGQQAQHPATSLSQISVPIDATESQWRAWVLNHNRGPAAAAVSRSTVTRLRREIRAVVHASGGTLIRLKLWRGEIKPPPVEVVVATATPAVYLRHRLQPLVNRLAHGYMFVKVVNRRGSMVFEWTRQTTAHGSPEGSVGVPRRLQMCSPVSASWIDNPPPCPTS